MGLRPKPRAASPQKCCWGFRPQTPAGVPPKTPLGAPAPTPPPERGLERSPTGSGAEPPVTFLRRNRPGPPPGYGIARPTFFTPTDLRSFSVGNLKRIQILFRKLDCVCCCRFSLSMSLFWSFAASWVKLWSELVLPTSVRAQRIITEFVALFAQKLTLSVTQLIYILAQTAGKPNPKIYLYEFFDGP